MAANSVAFNPNATTNIVGSFVVTAQGLYQGTFIDDPAKRFELRAGVLAAAETLPMWGGVGITEKIAPTGFDVRGNQISRATAQTNLTGFSVFNQWGSAINSPQSPVPVGLSGGQVNFFSLGSGARLALAIDPTLVDLDGLIVTSQVSWDYVNQEIVAYDAVAALPIIIESIQTVGAKTVSYNAGTQVCTWVSTGNACAIVRI